MSKKVLSILICIALTALLSSCVEISSTVKVNKDGSGQIVERYLTSKKFEEIYANTIRKNVTAAGIPTESEGAEVEMPPHDPEAIYKEGRYVLRAEQMGCDIQSIKKIKGRAGSYGVEVVYLFEDINQVRLSVQPPMDVAAEPELVGNAYLHFEFTEGKPAILTVRAPDELPSEEAVEEALEKADKFRDLLRDREFQDLARQVYRIDVQVEINEGVILGGNAVHIEKDKKGVTLLSVDVARMIRDVKTADLLDKLEEMKDLYARLEKFAKTDPKALLKKIDSLTTIKDLKALDDRLKTINYPDKEVLKVVVNLKKQFGSEVIDKAMDDLSRLVKIAEQFKDIRLTLEESIETKQWIPSEIDELNSDLSNAVEYDLTEREQQALKDRVKELDKIEKSIKSNETKIKSQMIAAYREVKNFRKTLSSETLAVLDAGKAAGLDVYKKVLDKMPAFIKVDPQTAITMYIGSPDDKLPTVKKAKSSSFSTIPSIPKKEDIPEPTAPSLPDSKDVPKSP